jgi:hypothetical protein
MLRFKIDSLVISLFLLVFVAAGCAGLKEGKKGFLGVSTKILEEKRSEAEILQISCDYFTCYQKVFDKLEETQSYVYAKQEDLIAVYLSSTNTTPVGIFFKELDRQKTQLEISSPSSNARKLIKKRLLSAFEKEVEVTSF